MNNDEFEQQLSQAMKSQQEPIPAHIQGRLRAARRTALEQSSEKPRSIIGKPALAGLALCTAGVLSFALLTQQDALPVGDRADDMLMLTSNDDLELFEEMEFLIWLEQQDTRKKG